MIWPLKTCVHADCCARWWHSHCKYQRESQAEWRTLGMIEVTCQRMSFSFLLSLTFRPTANDTWQSPRSRTRLLHSLVTTARGTKARGLKRSTEGILCCCWCVGMSVHIYVCVVVCMWVWVDLGSECKCIIMQGGILFSQWCSGIAHARKISGGNTVTLWVRVNNEIDSQCIMLCVFFPNAVCGCTLKVAYIPITPHMHVPANEVSQQRCIISDQSQYQYHCRVCAYMHVCVPVRVYVCLYVCTGVRSRASMQESNTDGILVPRQKLSHESTQTHLCLDLFWFCHHVCLCA